MLLPSIFNDNFTDDFFGDMFSYPLRDFDFQRFSGMHADVQEFDDKYEMNIELPGYDKSDVTAELKNGYLTIAAKHSDNKDEKDEKGKYIRRERYQGECRRSFFVGDEVEQKDIQAKFNNGILTLDIAKVKETPKVEKKQLIAIEG